MKRTAHGVKTRSELSREAGQRLCPVHHSTRNLFVKPRNMSRMNMTDEARVGLTDLALSIFTDCANVGVSLQDSILAVYLSGLNHGHETTKETIMSTDIHPAPQEFTADEIAQDAILRFFHYAHLPASLQARSKPFCDLARHIIDTTPRNAERTVALRKLLEAKDAGVRAALP